MLSQRSHSSQAPSEEHFHSLVVDTVRYILGQAHSKLPIKRQDIIRNVLKDYSRSFKSVIVRVKAILKEVYSINLVEVEKSSAKPFILVSQFRCKDIPEIGKLLGQEQKLQQALLMIVLSFIFMKGGVVREAVLWDFLQKLNLIKEEHEFVHKTFGDVRRIVSQDFVRQLYLEHHTVTDSDPMRYEFRFGKRTEIEVSYRSLLEFVTVVYGNSKPDTWRTQFQAVLQQEELKSSELASSLSEISNTQSISSQSHNASSAVLQEYSGPGTFSQQNGSQRSTGLTKQSSQLFDRDVGPTKKLKR